MLTSCPSLLWSECISC